MSPLLEIRALKLIQPLMHNPDPQKMHLLPSGGRTGDLYFDALLPASYAGASEYEHSALREAFLRMRALDLGVFGAELTRKGVTRTLHIVASRGSDGYENWLMPKESGSEDIVITSIQEALQAFQLWLGQPRIWIKGDLCRFPSAWDETTGLGGSKDDVKAQSAFCQRAWWALEANFFWTFDKQLALMAKQAFHPSRVLV